MRAVVKTTADGAAPKRATGNAYEVLAAERDVIYPGMTSAVRCGFEVAKIEGARIMLVSDRRLAEDRSAHLVGAPLELSPGTGEVVATLRNDGMTALKIEHGDSVARMIALPLVELELEPEPEQEKRT